MHILGDCNVLRWVMLPVDLNIEQGTTLNRIQSIQALLTCNWDCVTRCMGKVCCMSPPVLLVVVVVVQFF